MRVLSGVGDKESPGPCKREESAVRKELEPQAPGITEVVLMSRWVATTLSLYFPPKMISQCLLMIDKLILLTLHT